ncbi:MAG: glycoside hydrolase family 27 protein [Clostridia bacterium]|nr:glycoside hydrolase family 27 protein [Clostridia bacterium]MBR5382186.1 glycoside hydrolase family 27 protein [Clostridia bacterium]
MLRPQTPPMGWNSWDCYGAAVTEKEVRQNAGFMAANLSRYGWEYVVVDIQWYEPGATSHAYRPFADLCMDEYGRLLPAPNRFPSAAGNKGFAPLAEYVHSLGLKFGIHIMRGIPRQAVHGNCPVLGTDKTARDAARFNSICVWNPDMYGAKANEAGQAYYDSIFQMYAQWGVDFIKCDDICRELPHEEEELLMIARALENCGREMILSLSPGPALLEKAELYKQVANMWRITDDFWDDWKLLYAMFERAEKWSMHAGDGHYPDADMLPIGPIRQDYDKNNRTAFTENEQVTMMTLWSIMRSPLIIGGEMTGFDEFTMKLITNEGVLRMHRNSRNARQAFRRHSDGSEFIVWTADDCEGGSYIAAFNAGEADAHFMILLEELELCGRAFRATELWSGETEELQECVSTEIPRHGAKVFYLQKT